MKIKSSAFENNHYIPTKYTCEGDDVSPPLTFQDVPKGIKTLALIVDDPDAPHGTFVHWIAWNISPNTGEFKEGGKAPDEGTNGYGEIGYRGPCPPPGSPHRYFFKLFALDTLLNMPEGSTKRNLEEAMEGHIIGKAELIGLYQR